VKENGGKSVCTVEIIECYKNCIAIVINLILQFFAES
jgi:hypothetical protein